jgi:fatty acid desaturase
MKPATSTFHTDRRFPLDRDTLIRLAQRAPLRLLAQTAFEWLCIIALIVLAQACSNIAVSVLCMFLIATRQHALLALMHEYSHYQLSRSRAWWNDMIGDIFTALPFFVTIHGFRRNHMEHHRSASPEHDMNMMFLQQKARYQFPMSKTRFFAEIVKHAIGWYTLDELKGYTVERNMALQLPRSTRVLRAVLALALIAAATWFGWWGAILLYWILPMSTFMMAILYVRDVGEHLGLPSAGIANSRTVKAGWLERFLIAQNGVNFHAEHHLYPSVPFFRLDALHDALMRDANYRAQAVVTQGYFSGLVEEVTRRHNQTHPALQGA